MALFKKSVKGILKEIASLSEDDKAELLAMLDEEDEPETEEKPEEATEETAEATEEATEKAQTEPEESIEEAETATEAETAEAVEEATEGTAETETEPTAQEQAAEEAQTEEAQERAEFTLETLAARIAALEEKLANATENKAFGVGAGFTAENKDINEMSYDELKRKMIESGDIVRR